jgi:outer membrane protein TolC
MKKTPRFSVRGSIPLPLTFFFILVHVAFLCCANQAFSQYGETAPGAESKGAPPPLPLTLDEAVNRALQANRSIASTKYAAEGQYLSVVSARSEFETKIVPAVNVGISGGDNTGPPQGYGGGFSIQQKLESGTKLSLGPAVNKAFGVYSTDVGLSIEQPLFKGFGRESNLDRVRTAIFNMASADRSLHQLRINTFLDVVTTYYDALKNGEIVHMYESMARRLRGHAEVAQAKEKVGLATPMDTYRAEIRLKDAEDALTQARESYQDNRDRLKVLLALPLETDMDLVSPLKVEIVEVGLESVIETALTRRVDMEQAREDIREAERRVAVARHNILPDISLVVGYDQFGLSDRFQQSTGLDQNRWSVRLVSSTDLFRTAEKSAYQQSLLNLKSIQLNLEGRKDEIRRQVRRQFTALKEAERRIAIRKEQIRQAEGKLALAEVKFAHSMADNFDVIEAETELQRSKINLLSSEIDYIVGTYSLRAISGTLIERSAA